MNETMNQQTTKNAGINSDTAKLSASTFSTIERAVTITQQFATQIANGPVASIGSRTGNYALQERVQNSINLASKAAGIGVSFAINPYLGAAHLVGEVVVTGVQLAVEAVQRNRDIMWQNRAASELARRAGYLADQNR